MSFLRPVLWAISLFCGSWVAEETAAAASKSPSSLESFVALQKALRSGFSEDKFQDNMVKEAKAWIGATNRECAADRRCCFWPSSFACQDALQDLKEKCERGELKKTQFLEQRQWACALNSCVAWAACLSHFALRQKLFLTVQSQVLPKFGYEGTSLGVYKMMGDMKPYVQATCKESPLAHYQPHRPPRAVLTQNSKLSTLNCPGKEPEFVVLADEINALLGIDYSPPDTWTALSDSCQKLNDDKDEVRRFAPEARRPKPEHRKNEFRRDLFESNMVDKRRARL